MATLFSTTGIVLSQRNHREADRWYSAFTPEHGKIEFLARGGHKPLAKLTPHLEMPAEVEFLLVDGRAYLTVAGTDRRRAFSNIYTDYSRLSLAQSALSLTDLATRPQEADPALYDTLVRFLSFIDAAPDFSTERAAFLLSSFTLKLLALTGYRPELERCLHCKNSIAQGQYRWHAVKGGVVCMPCATGSSEEWFAARSIPDEALKLLRFALFEPFESQIKPFLSAEAILPYHDLVESLVISHFPAIPACSLRSACS